MEKKIFTGYKFKEEKIYDGDILIIHRWCEIGSGVNSDIGKYDEVVKWKVSLSEYTNYDDYDDEIEHCGWNANGWPLPSLVKNEYLLSSNSFTKCEGIEKS